MCKEYVSLIVIMLGVYIVLKKNNIKIGTVTFLLGLFWFFMVYKLIPSFFQTGKEKMMIQNYSHLGSSIGEVLRNVILHPINTLLKVITFEKMATIVLLLLPIGFLALLNLYTLFIGLPVLAGLILSDFFAYTNHHNGTLIPFIFISSIFSAEYLIRKFSHKFKNIYYAVAIFVLLSSLFSSIFYGASPLSWRFWDKSSYRYWGNLQQFKVTQHDKIADKFIKMIPPEASVSASNHLASHLSQRQTIYHFPYPKDFKEIDYILVDLLEYFPTYWGPREEEIDTLKSLLSNNNFKLLLCEDGILLFKRTIKIGQGYRLKAGKARGASLQNPLNLPFDNRLLLMGYNLKDRHFERGRTYRIIYYWKVLSGFDKGFLYTYFGNTEGLNTEYIIIDSLENEKNKFHIVHLPTYILFKPKNWKVGNIIREEYDFYIPENIPAGNYKWKIGLYATPKYFFIKIGAKNTVPGTKEILLGEVEVK
jgi:hypothetical protein